MALTLTDYQVTDLARPLAGMIDTIAKFYENPEVKKGFEEWHLKKFGCKPTNMTTRKDSKNEQQNHRQ